MIDLSRYRKVARVRYLARAETMPLGRLWLWWKMLTYDVADDPFVPNGIRIACLEARQEW